MLTGFFLFSGTNPYPGVYVALAIKCRSFGLVIDPARFLCISSSLIYIVS
jgi:hypothetical protein